MNKGFIIHAENSGDNDYIQMAYLLALSIKKFNNINNVSLLCGNSSNISVDIKNVFDEIIDITWLDGINHSSGKQWKEYDRWKIYHASPYFETIMLDADMLILKNIDHWWDFLGEYDLHFCTKIKNYRGEFVEYNPIRNIWYDNNLDNIFCAFTYFKKSDLANEFYDLVKDITFNYEIYKNKFAHKNNNLNEFNTDMGYAIASKIMNLNYKCTSDLDFPSFIHMKPQLQNKYIYDEIDWTKFLLFNINDNGVYISNYKIHDVLHYINKKIIFNKNIINYLLQEK